MSSAIRCLACGRQCSASEKFCPACNACLLVDVLVEAEDHDRRAVYMAAKEIDLIGAEAPTFELVRLRLEAAPSRIAADCSRETARRIVNILRKYGIPTRVLPLRRPGRTSVQQERLFLKFRLGLKRLGSFIRGLSPAMRITLGAVLVLGVGLLFFALKSSDASSENPQAVIQSEGAGSLSTREIVFAALRSNVEIRVKGHSALAFFIAPDLLLTNAPLVEGDWIDVILAEGEIARGAVERSDAWIGLSLIRVVGAAAPFLRIGDASLLERGQALTLVGRPEAGKFSATQGILTRTDLIDFGRAYFVIDAGFAAEGTPVLDSSASVVGVLTSGIPMREGSYAAIPINYLTSGRDAMLRRPHEAGTAERWEEMMRDVDQKDAAEYAGIRSGLGRPSLLQVSRAGPDALEVAVWEYVSYPPSSEELFFDLVRGHEILCSLNANTGLWAEFSERDSDPGLYRKLQWLQHHDPKGKLYTSKLYLVSLACPKDLSGADLLLSSENPSANRGLASP